MPNAVRRWFLVSFMFDIYPFGFQTRPDYLATRLVNVESDSQNCSSMKLHFQVNYVLQLPYHFLYVDCKQQPSSSWPCPGQRTVPAHKQPQVIQPSTSNNSPMKKQGKKFLILADSFMTKLHLSTNWNAQDFCTIRCE